MEQKEEEITALQWDIAGQEKFISSTPFPHNAAAAIISQVRLSVLQFLQCFNVFDQFYQNLQYH